MTAHVDVQIACDDKALPDENEITKWVGRAIESAGVNGDSEVSVRVVDAAEMQQLNAEYRDKDRPTNVLSFPTGGIEGLPPDAGLPLGDIVVCAAVVNSEAEQQGKSNRDHWAHMIVHGTLHLLGFDHENDADATVMENLEIEILTSHGLANPYTI